MAGQEKWYFTREQLMNSPSRKCGLDPDKELSYRQQAANLIQDMGQRLQVTQLCINTAIVYMHRFYAFHSFTQFHRNSMAAAALFLAAKVEEQPRKLEYVIKVAHVCLHRSETTTSLDPRSEHYQELAQDLVFNENVLLQTLGFDVAIDHPHTHVVRTCHLVKAPKDLAQTSYFMASNSLHLTTMCLQYRPTVVACFCIHLATKWSNWAIPQSNEGRHWFQYVDRTVTTDLLERLTAEFLYIFDKCPSRLKKKMMSMSNNPQQPSPGSNSSQRESHGKIQDDGSFDRDYEREKRRSIQPGGYVPAAHGGGSSSGASGAHPHQHPPPNKIDLREYREKKEREMRHHQLAIELKQQQQQQQQQNHAQHTSTGQPRVPGGPPHKPHHSHRQHSSSSSSSSIPGSRPVAAISSGSSSAAPSGSGTASVEAPVPRARPPSLFSPENTTAPHQIASARRPNVPPSASSHSTHHHHQHQQRKPPPHYASAPPPMQSTSSSHQRPQSAGPPQPHVKRPTHPPPPPSQQPQQQPTVAGGADQQSVTAQSQPHQNNYAVKRPAPQHVTAQSHTESPPAKKQSRMRTGSSSSEPELVPVVKKLEDMPHYDKLLSRSSANSNQTPSTPKLPQPNKPPQQLAPSHRPVVPVNGIETDPALVSNLLKESLLRAPPPITVPHQNPPPSEASLAPRTQQAPQKQSPAPPQQPMPAPQPTPTPQPAPVQQQAPPMQQQQATATQPSDEKPHKSEKKKKKDKHKHKDKSKEERKKHKKDKDRDKSKHKDPPPVPTSAAPAMPPSMVPTPSFGDGLKIKIPKERLATTPSLKLKIPKEVMRPGLSSSANGQHKEA